MRSLTAILVITGCCTVLLLGCGVARPGVDLEDGDCKIDGDCAEASLCIDGYCLSACNGQADCQMDEACVEELCLPVFGGDGCNDTCEAFDLVCGLYEICGEVVDCGTCAETETCEAGACVEEPCVVDCECTDDRSAVNVCGAANCGVVPDTCGVDRACGACDDGNDCTANSCNAGTCETVDLDDDPCTLTSGAPGVCNAGACVSGQACVLPCLNNGTARCELNADSDPHLVTCPALAYGAPLCEARQICTDGCWVEATACASDQVCSSGSCVTG